MSKIEWTEKTWNPIVGCSIVSLGCTNCYAMKMAARIDLMSASGKQRWTEPRDPAERLSHYAGLTKPSKAGPVWTGKLAQAPEHILTKPLRRKKPTMYFVNSMSDLFHEDVPDEWIDRVFAVMATANRHTYQVLTKRSERMRRYLTSFRDDGQGFVTRDGVDGYTPGVTGFNPARWPLPNVWLGVSAERQEEADARIPDLLNTPAAVRFVSAEPLLGPLHLEAWLNPHEFCERCDDGDGYGNRCGSATIPRHEQCPWRHAVEVVSDDGMNSDVRTLDWIIVGGESGPGAQPMHPDWARSIRDQCVAADVPFFFKQWGAWLVGERQEQRDDLTWQPDVTFADGTDFAVLSDGHDIVLGGAEDEQAGPKHLWREFWGWQGHLIKRAPTKSLRLLDGREWHEIPAQRTAEKVVA